MNNYVQEAYYGKLPEFEKLEALFDKVIAKANKDGIGKCNPNKYPEQKKICEVFSKLFGFKKSIIYWEPYYMANAYTYSLNVFMVYSDKKKLIEKKPERGFYDTSHSIVLTVYISVGLLEKKLSSREMIAVILHEIGHNFDYSNYHKFEAALYAIGSLGMDAFYIHKNKNRTNEMKMDVYDQISLDDDTIYKSQKKRDQINTRMRNSEKNYYKNRVVDGFFAFINIPIYLLCGLFSPILQITNIAGKKGELFADSFATAYGYGEELISALNKFEDNKPIWNPKSPIQKFFFDLGKLEIEISTSIFAEVHGTNMERCQECIEKLKWDLKHNDFSPELKEELVEEINKMTAQYKAYTQLEKDDQLKITKMYRKVIAVLFHGKPNIQKFFKRNKV